MIKDVYCAVLFGLEVVDSGGATIGKVREV